MRKEGEARAGTGRMSDALTYNAEKQKVGEASTWAEAGHMDDRSREAQVFEGRRTEGRRVEMKVLKASCVRVGFNPIVLWDPGQYPMAEKPRYVTMVLR